MTANQIAYRQTVLEEERNEAEKANKERVAAENERHNTATEAINATSNDIESKKADETARHNREMEQIQDQYNTKYLELQNAEFERRAEIEQELARIKEYEAEELKRHNQANEELAANNLAVSKSQAEEIARHNQALEGLESDTNAIREEQNRLKAQEQSMSASYQAGLLTSEYSKREIELINVQNQHELGLLGLQAREAELRLQQARIAGELEKSKSETVRNYLQAGADVLRSIGNVLTFRMLDFNNMEATHGTSKTKQRKSKQD